VRLGGKVGGGGEKEDLAISKHVWELKYDVRPVRNRGGGGSRKEQKPEKSADHSTRDLVACRKTSERSSTGHPSFAGERKISVLSRGGESKKN